MELVEVAPEQPLESSTNPPLGPEDICDNNPEFAVICSFIKEFGSRIDLELDIEKLKSGLENQDSLDDDLIEIHVKLLKKFRRYFVRDQWEKALMRYAFEYSYEHGREIETRGYLKTRPSIKLQLLRRLLDAQFECDPKFKAAVNNDEATELRNQPLGRDIRGNIYWHCQDKEGHLRVYNEQPSDHKSWKVVCKDIIELDKLIEDLDLAKDDKIKGEPQVEPYNPYPDIFPEYFIKTKNDFDFTKNEVHSSESKVESELLSKRATKKGRRGRLIKKSSSPLAVQSLSDHTEPNKSTNSQKENNLNHHPVEPKSVALEEFNQATSIESQVKQTLDSILQRVSTSLDFFFRWNSNNEKKDDIPVKPRKRNPKREKVPQDELPRRTSSRIQQMQQRKITEYVERKAEPRIPADDVKVFKTTKEEVKSGNTHFQPKKAPRKDKQRWRAKGKKKLSWDKDDSDLSSVSSLTESNDESFVEELNGALDPDTIQESDEFACEEEETNDAPVIIKRARTARQMVDSQEEGISVQGRSIVEEDKPCGRCDKSNDPECILLCDMCDDGYHTACCIPPLMFIPDGDWFCPQCEHKTLLTKLRDISSVIREILSERERERQKRQRLRHAFKKNVVTHTNDEIVPQKRNKIDLPHGKDYSRWKQVLSSEDESFKSSDDESQPKTRRARACVSYQFKEFDELIQSAIQTDSEEDIPMNEDAPEEKASSYGRGKDMATIEAIAYQQENGIKDQIITIESNPIVPTGNSNTSRSRKKGRRLNDLDAESEIDVATSDDSFQAASETDVEEEEEEITEVDSEDDSSFDEIIQVGKSNSGARRKKSKMKYRYESDESDYEPRTRRRTVQKVSYKESTDDEEDVHVGYKESTEDEEDVAMSFKESTDDEDDILNVQFYREDEVRPPSNSTSNNKQKSW